MRRKASERNKAKATPEKSPEKSTRRSHRHSRRRRKSSSSSSSDDNKPLKKSEDKPEVKSTDQNLESQPGGSESIVQQNIEVELPSGTKKGNKKSSPQEEGGETVADIEIPNIEENKGEWKEDTEFWNASNEPKPESLDSTAKEKDGGSLWKVQSANGAGGEIQKLKICRQRPADTPEISDTGKKSTRSSRHSDGGTSSRSTDDSLHEDGDKDSKRLKHRTRTSSRNNSPLLDSPKVVCGVSEESPTKIKIINVTNLTVDKSVNEDDSVKEIPTPNEQIEVLNNENKQEVQNDVISCDIPLPNDEQKDIPTETKEETLNEITIPPEKEVPVEPIVKSLPEKSNVENESNTVLDLDVSDIPEPPTDDFPIQQSPKDIEYKVEENKEIVEDTVKESKQIVKDKIEENKEIVEGRIREKEIDEVKGKKEDKISEKKANGSDSASKSASSSSNDSDSDNSNNRNSNQKTTKVKLKRRNLKRSPKPSPTLENSIKESSDSEEESKKEEKVDHEQETVNTSQNENETSKTSTHLISVGGENEITLEERLPRKRRWGASKTIRPNKKPIVSISTNSLKELVPGAKPVPAEELQLSVEEEEGQIDDDDEEDEVTILIHEEKLEEKPKVKTEVIDEKKTDHNKEGAKSEEKHKKRIEKKEKIKLEEPPSNDKNQRKIRLLTDDSNKLAQSPSPPRRRPSSVLYITNLVRPFTVQQLKNLLLRTGTIAENGFWIDSIKSKCYVEYTTEDAAVETRHALHGVRWPVTNPKTLIVDFSTHDDMAVAQALAEETDPIPRKAEPLVIDRSVEGWLAEQARLKLHGERPIRRVMAAVREWDVGKPEHPDEIIEQDLRMKEHQREQERRARKERSHRSPTPDNDVPGRKQRRKEDDAPAKMLDDLFRKTKSSPCIYWLPLSQEQIVVKEEMRRQHMAEHERRMAELKKAELARRDRERRNRK